MSDPEKFTGTVHAGIVAHWNLVHAKSGAFELLSHFDTDDAAPGFQFDSVENVSAEKPEVAVDVAYR